MATAKLISPNRLFVNGRLWERNVTQEVSVDVARNLSVNPRFEVTGLNGPAPEPVEVAQVEAPVVIAAAPAAPLEARSDKPTPGVRIKKLQKSAESEAVELSAATETVVQDTSTEGSLEV